MCDEYGGLPGYCLTNPNAIQNLLEQSQRMLVRAFEAQNLEKYDDSFEYLTKAGSLITLLCSAADDQLNTRYILREHVDILSKAQLDQFCSEYSYLLQPSQIPEFDTTPKKPPEPKHPKTKQIKHVWTPEEEELFHAGLKKYGEKGIKEISEFIGSRTPAQVRSHLQKYQKKLSKGREVLQTLDK